eukprot:sb/3473597/
MVYVISIYIYILTLLPPSSDSHRVHVRFPVPSFPRYNSYSLVFGGVHYERRALLGMRFNPLVCDAAPHRNEVCSICQVLYQACPVFDPVAFDMRCRSLARVFNSSFVRRACSILIMIIIFRACIPPIPDGNMSKYWRCSDESLERYILD